MYALYAEFIQEKKTNKEYLHKVLDKSFSNMARFWRYSVNVNRSSAQHDIAKQISTSNHQIYLLCKKGKKIN